MVWRKGARVNPTLLLKRPKARPSGGMPGPLWSTEITTYPAADAKKRMSLATVFDGVLDEIGRCPGVKSEVPAHVLAQL
jgi:hypothetical protein